MVITRTGRNAAVGELYGRAETGNIIAGKSIYHNDAGGLYFLADGLFKVQISFDSRSFGIGDWWVILIPALATVVFGALLVARPADSARVLAVLTGISMLCEGILNIITMITAVKIIGHQRPDEIEADFFDDERQD